MLVPQADQSPGVTSSYGSLCGGPLGCRGIGWCLCCMRGAYGPAHLAHHHHGPCQLLLVQLEGCGLCNDKQERVLNVQLMSSLLPELT